MNGAGCSSRASAAQLFAVVALLADCSGSPSAPSQSSTLATGRYAFRVESTTVPLSSVGNVSGGIFACSGRSDNAATVTVDVAMDGASWRGTTTSGTLAFTLQRSGSTFCGVIDGTATASDGTVVQVGDASLVKSSSADGRLCGDFTSGALAGMITADVTFLYATGATTFGHCAGNSFTLKRQ